jgi:hypothetical protein
MGLTIRSSGPLRIGTVSSCISWQRPLTSSVMHQGQGSISVEQAIGRAFWTVKVPSLLLMFGPFVIFQLFTTNSQWIGNPGFELFALSFGSGFLLAWLAWSVLIPPWRLWAYKRVNNIEALKAHAVAAQLIWPEGHFFQRTELAPSRVWREISSLEQQKPGVGA